MSLITFITAFIAGQKRQLNSLEDVVSRAVAELKLSPDHLQKLSAKSEDFQLAILEAVQELTVDKFAAEELVSNFAYPENFQVKDIFTQVKILRDYFPELKRASFDKQVLLKHLPDQAEGWFAIPHWQALAPTYSLALEKVRAALATSRPVHDFTDGRLTADYLRPQARAMRYWQRLSDRQPGQGIILVPGQFGLKQRGRSFRRAWEVRSSLEFGLGSWAISAMLLTHPERLASGSLNISCIGDEVAWDYRGSYEYFPILNANADLGWQIAAQDSAYHNFGAVTAFLV